MFLDVSVTRVTASMLPALLGQDDLCEERFRVDEAVPASMLPALLGQDDNPTTPWWTGTGYELQCCLPFSGRTTGPSGDRSTTTPAASMLPALLGQDDGSQNPPRLTSENMTTRERLVKQRPSGPLV